MWGENKLIHVECLAYKEVIQPNLCSKGRGMLISVHLKSFCLCLHIVPQMSDLHALSLPQIGAYSLLWNFPHSTLNYAIICKLLRSKDCLLCLPLSTQKSAYIIVWLTQRLFSNSLWSCAGNSSRLVCKVGPWRPCTLGWCPRTSHTSSASASHFSPHCAPAGLQSLQLASWACALHDCVWFNALLSPWNSHFLNRRPWFLFCVGPGKLCSWACSLPSYAHHSLCWEHSPSLLFTGWLNFFLIVLFIYGSTGCRASLVAPSRGYSSCGAQASHCAGFSCWWAGALGCEASVVGAQGLSCSMARACGSIADQDFNPCSVHWQADY